MSLPLRPLALSLTIALLGAAGVASAAPVPAGMQDPQPRAPRQAPPAQVHPQHSPAPRQQARPRHADPLSDSIRRVERRTRGQVISAERVPYDGRSVSRVKVVDDEGRVRIYMDDPQAAGGEPRTRRDDD
jgi:hypothetical protein